MSHGFPLVANLLANSEVVFQSELQLSRTVGGAGHSAHSGVVYTGARTIEISIVRKVESLSAELQLRRLRYRKLLGKRHGDASEVISSQYPRARVTVCEVGMYRETALVEPRRQRRVIKLAGTGAVRSLAANSRVGDIARNRGRCKPGRCGR